MQDNWKSIEDFIARTYKIRGEVNIQPYSYRVAFDGLAPAESVTNILAANANADFILTSPRYRAVDQDGDSVEPQVRVLLTDTGSAVQLSDQAVDLTTMFGRIGSAPYQIEYPRIIAGRSSLQVQVTNYSTTKTYAFIELTFAGVLVQSYKS